MNSQTLWTTVWAAHILHLRVKTRLNAEIVVDSALLSWTRTERTCTPTQRKPRRPSRCRKQVSTGAETLIFLMSTILRSSPRSEWTYTVWRTSAAKVGYPLEEGNRLSNRGIRIRKSRDLEVSSDIEKTLKDWIDKTLNPVQDQELRKVVAQDPNRSQVQSPGLDLWSGGWTTAHLRGKSLATMTGNLPSIVSI